MTTSSVTSAKNKQLNDRMEQLGISEQDIVEKFIKGSGPGGQKINKTSSCVYILHKPSGIEIKCQQERSQTMNRYLAKVELCEQLEARAREALMGRAAAQQSPCAEGPMGCADRRG